MLALTLTACSDDDKDISYDNAPEKAAAGTYSGTWSRVAEGEEVTGTGTVTLTATGTAYNVDVAFDCPDFDISATSVANIAHANDGFVFNNNLSGNGLEAAFGGKIDESGNLGVNFQKEVKVGRKRTVSVFTFIGKKN